METIIDNLVELTIFDKVASAGSLTGAANELGLSVAVVSKRLAALEARMHVRLLNRTTRRQSLTQEGERFHLHCVRILAEVQQAEATMQHSRTEIDGHLRHAQHAALALPARRQAGLGRGERDLPVQ
jgi:DNA-binding transcriptional LysR family regulator